MSGRRWLPLLLASVGCTQTPDVVASDDAVSAGGVSAGGAPAAEIPELIALSGATDMRDPSALFDGARLWFFGSGGDLPIRATSDLSVVTDEGAAFVQPPEWVATLVPNAKGFWSPEIAFFGGAFHLYYAVSTLGSSRSCIGHATRDQLGAGSAWLDQGAVICSSLTDDWNAIDPNLLETEDGALWLAFGSYLSGIKLVRLDAEGMKPASDMVALATRTEGGGALQAAALAQHQGYFYLFVSFGVDTSHRLLVGRASAIEGPYVDRQGERLLDGAGTSVLEADARFAGPGSNDIVVNGERTYNVYHAYDAENAGRPVLRVATLVWDDEGWPMSGGP